MSYLDPKGRDFSDSDVHLRLFALAVYDADDSHYLDCCVGHKPKLPDLLPRLIFADKLEELGYVVRAEFIRLCCAIATTAQDTRVDPVQAAHDEEHPAYDTPELDRLVELITPPKAEVNRRWAELLGLNPDDAPEGLKSRFSVSDLTIGFLTGTLDWMTDFRARHVVRLLAHHPISLVNHRWRPVGRSRYWYMYPISSADDPAVRTAVTESRTQWFSATGAPDDLYAYLLDYAEAEEAAGRKVPRMIPHRLKGRPPYLRFETEAETGDFHRSGLDFARQRLREALKVDTPVSRVVRLSNIRQEVEDLAKQAEAIIYVHPHDVNLTDPPQEQADRLVAAFRARRNGRTH